MAALNLFRLLGDLMHLLSIVILGLKINSTRSCSGISLKSQILYFVVYISRYLDFFAMLKWDVLHIYNALMKIFFVGSEAAILYFITKKYRASYDPRMDSFRIALLVAPSIVLAFFMADTSQTRTFFGSVREYFWTFSLLLEAVAILPQLFMLQKTGEAESITTHYLLCLGLYRAFYLLNWIWRWIIGEKIDTLALLAGIVQTAVYSDFFWVYYKRVFQGKAFKLPI
jgi:ER lumen protein retaining receptor